MRRLWSLNIIITMELLENVGEIMQERFLIASAYRAPEYNRTLRGAATNSVHKTGRALDVHGGVARPSDPLNEEFRRICRGVGFVRFGRYPLTNDGRNNFTHIDLGWSDDDAAPAEWNG